MGSSAALTTSLVGSLLQFFGIIDLQSTSSTLREADRSIIHNLSQLIHSVAQGKIGSGFDVAAAVYGSQIYRRFSESKIPFDRLISDDPHGELLYSTVRDRSLWDQDILPFHLPCGMDIVMGDVCGGSSSSSMVLTSPDFLFPQFQLLRLKLYFLGKRMGVNLPMNSGIEFEIPMKPSHLCLFSCQVSRIT